MTQFQANDGSSVCTTAAGVGEDHQLVNTNGGTRGWMRPACESISPIASSTDYENNLMRDGPYLMLETKIDQEAYNAF
jgi:hypothetical protein